jgi:DNA transformation protein
MPLDRTYANEIVDMLQTLGHVTGRAMFGGFGIWEKGAMFAAIDSDSVLYFKTNADSETDYRAAGSTQFAPKMPGRGPHPMPYWSVPAEVLDDQETLETWALRAIRVAHASKLAARAPKSSSEAPQAKNPAKPRPATLPPKKKAPATTTEAKPTTTTQPPHSARRKNSPTAPVQNGSQTKAREASALHQTTQPPTSAARESTSQGAQPRPSPKEDTSPKGQPRGSRSAPPRAKKETTAKETTETRAPTKRPTAPRGRPSAAKPRPKIVR